MGDELGRSQGREGKGRLAGRFLGGEGRCRGEEGREKVIGDELGRLQRRGGKGRVGLGWLDAGLLAGRGDAVAEDWQG